MTDATPLPARLAPYRGIILLFALTLLAHRVAGSAAETPPQNPPGSPTAHAEAIRPATPNSLVVNPLISGATSQPLDPKAAEAKAHSGKYQLHVGNTGEAQTQCSQALASAPANQTAKECLELAASMAIDAQLNNADNLILQGKRADAVPIAAGLVHSPASDEQRKRAKIILRMARPSVPARIWNATPDWIRQIIITLLFILVATIIIRTARRIWIWILTQSRNRKPFRRKTIWNMLPLEGTSGTNDGQKATDGLLDALARLGEQLHREPWAPRLLLLRPTPPADYEPAVISDFLAKASQPPLPPIVLEPELSALRLECNFHEVRLDEAVQNLQLKAGSGIDFGSVLRFLIALGKWITSGTPTISGLVERTSSVDSPAVLPPAVAPAAPAGPAAPAVDTQGSAGALETVSVHLAARGIGVHTVSITTSNDVHRGIDCVQLATERAAFKFLIRMKYPQMTNEEVNGHAALRQGASLFSEFAGTIPAGGSAAATRASSLKSAAHNLAFFRTSIPVQCANHDVAMPLPLKNLSAGHRDKPEGKSAQEQKQSSQVASIKISDEIRQALLLAEGVTNALIDDTEARDAAISCFRQLQEWPGSKETLPLRQQAEYNEAIVQRAMGFYGQSILMLTELLGDEVPGADGNPAAYKPSDSVPKNLLADAIRFPARVARLTAFAQYTREDWTTLPKGRAELLIHDARKLIPDLAKVCARTDISLHDCRLAKYMRGEAMRAAGHVELRNAIQGPAGRFYKSDTNRPTGLLTDALNENNSDDKAVIDNLNQSIEWMRDCEEFSPSCELFCDIAESYLLLKKFPGAQAYGRHATLQASPSTNSPSQVCDAVGKDPAYERAFYIAAESYALAGDKNLAKKYATRFPGTVTLDEFKALRFELGLGG